MTKQLAVQFENTNFQITFFKCSADVYFSDLLIMTLKFQVRSEDSLYQASRCEMLVKVLEFEGKIEAKNIMLHQEEPTSMILFRNRYELFLSLRVFIFDEYQAKGVDMTPGFERIRLLMLPLN